MKALELLIGQENILLEDSIESKKMQNLASNFNGLMQQMHNQINEFEMFSKSQLKGEYNDKIIITKSLANFFENNRLLKVEACVANLENEEKTKLSEYYQVKNKLLDLIKAIIKESHKDAVVSAYDIFDGDFVKCPEGHEIIILGGRNVNVLETLLSELDSVLVVNGNFANVQAQDVDYNIEKLNKNIELCTRKNSEIYGTRPSKSNKITILIDRLQSISHKIVAFYTYKNSLELIGCPAKGIKDYENELNKVYLPLKKTLQKELRIELEDLSAVEEAEFVVNQVEESEYTSPLASLLDNANNDNINDSEVNDNLEIEEVPTLNEETNLESEESITAIETNSEVAETTEEPEPARIDDPFEIASETTPNPFAESVEPSPFDSTESTSPFESTTSSDTFTSAYLDEERKPAYDTNFNPFESDNSSNSSYSTTSTTSSSYSETTKSASDRLSSSLESFKSAFANLNNTLNNSSYAGSPNNPFDTAYSSDTTKNTNPFDSDNN